MAVPAAVSPAAILALLLISLFGVRSLLIFSSRNGAFGHFEAAVNAGRTPGGRPLRTLTTRGRFPKVDQQINAVCVFFLLYCEDWKHPETSLAGLSFVGAWGASWALIMLDSLRVYSQHYLLSWISIPGVIIFNYSHAIFTPLYLAFRLLCTPAPSAPGLSIDPPHLNTFAGSFLLAYCAPIVALSLPGVTIGGVDTKHALAGVYQQWNLYISMCQWLLITVTRPGGYAQTIETYEGQLGPLRAIYWMILLMAGIAFWIPVTLALSERVRCPLGLQGTRLLRRPREVLMAPSPFGGRLAKDASEGGRWLIQWDTITGTVATAVWAAALYWEAMQEAGGSKAASLWAGGGRVLWLVLLGGPMGLPVVLLWQRDEMMLRAA